MQNDRYHGKARTKDAIISLMQVHTPNKAQEKLPVIAIDGPAGSGKSTVAQKVADSLGFMYIDTGAMYRAATWLVLKENIDLDDLEQIVKRVSRCNIELKPKDATSGNRVRVFVDSQEVTREIRSPEVSRAVSPVSAIPGVRQHLVVQQQRLGDSGGVVLDGRDIGTVVFPNAQLKIFLTARPQTRAKRRLKELEELGQGNISLEQLQRDIEERDRFDSSRAVAPLRQAPDAVVIDTDNMTIDKVVETILSHLRTAVQLDVPAVRDAKDSL